MNNPRSEVTHNSDYPESSEGFLRSNYKSLLLAEETTCREAIDILLSMNRKEPEGDYALFLTAPDGEAQIPSEVELGALRIDELGQYDMEWQQKEAQKEKILIFATGPLVFEWCCLIITI
ncbi:hypothetical protein ANCCEY_05220 [Ancylostoma ceylanicum]|uniref:Ras-associating domain-containing protein n=1 Tax=Ancylostoma ceylanicum TaxID=53326 RepID=A0A0D6LUC6_9BILA|nr:hypothetical protein ANCCEY_05220 [Ancylostoma ceylanicum]